MILTAEEYARGFIDFDAVLPEGCTVDLWTRTAEGPEDEGEWAGPYSTPEGSKVLSPPKRYMQLAFELKRGDDPTKTPILNKVRWECDGHTYIWPGPAGFNGSPGQLSLGRDYGVSYRLVFRPKRTVWSEPFVVITRTVRIRFLKGETKVYDRAGFRDAVPISNGTVRVEGAVKEVVVEGDIVEVLATIPSNGENESKEAAKSQVESVVGLLALCFGEQILGEPVYAEYFFSGATGEQGDIHVPVKHLVEISVDRNLASSTDDALVHLNLSPISSSISIALRWYAKGLDSESTVDSFIAYFIGLEALASGYFAGIDPKPVREEYIRLRQYFAQARPNIDSRLQEVVLSQVADFPLSIKFQEYWKNRFNSETRESREFSALNRLRNELLHGRAQAVTPHQVDAVKTLLEKLLARDLGVENTVSSRQAGPKLLEFVLRYATIQRDEKSNP